MYVSSLGCSTNYPAGQQQLFCPEGADQDQIQKGVQRECAPCVAPQLPPPKKSVKKRSENAQAETKVKTVPE